MPLDPVGVRRLAFVRYLHRLAVQQSRLPEPFCYPAVLGFHDAVEIFLVLACNHLNVGKTYMQFMEYFNTLQQKLGHNLSQRQAMVRLNEVRNALKHHGNWPNLIEIEGFRASATNFFEENTPAVFGVAFAAVSLIDFVVADDARESLEQAQAALEREDFNEAVTHAAIAYKQVIHAFEESQSDRYGQSPFEVGEDLRSGFNYSSKLQGQYPRADSDLIRFVRDVENSVTSLQNIVRSLALGVDHRRLFRFRKLVPGVDRMMDGPYHVSWAPQWTPDGTSESAQFCIDFVIETAVRLR